MASTQSKRSIRSAQPHKRSTQHSAISSQLTRNPKSRLAKNTPSKTKARKAPRSRRFHRFADARGKTLDFVEFYTAGDYHCLDVRFQDNTALTFTIEPSFTVEAEHTDWKTGDMRSLRQWPPVESVRL